MKLVVMYCFFDVSNCEKHSLTVVDINEGEK